MPDATAQQSLLLIGPGFLGGTVLSVLRQKGLYRVSVTCRSDSQASTLQQLGYNAVRASLDDTEAIKGAVAQHEVIINTASPDHEPSILATLAGIQQRHDAGLETTYLHTSGTGATLDDAEGRRGTDIILDDGEPDKLEASFNNGATHRLLDAKIAEQAAAWRSASSPTDRQSTGRARTEVRIILPPMIYGVGTGPFRKLSNVIPNVLRASIDAGSPVTQNGSVNTATCVHVEDLARAYSLLLQSLVATGDPRPVTRLDYYIFGTSGMEFCWSEVIRAIGSKLCARGLVKTAEAAPASREHLLKHDLIRAKELWGGTLDFCPIGGNDRSRATKLGRLGWKAERTSMESLLDGLDSDIDNVVSGTL